MERTDPGIQRPHGRERAYLSGALTLRCAGCGAEPGAAEPYPFRCPRADDGDDRDHVLVRAGRGATESTALVTDVAAAHPFLRYRGQFWFHALALACGVSDGEVVERIEALDRAIADMEGHGLEATPSFASAPLAARFGLAPGGVWVKDETAQVAGSHKARHLLGIALALEALERTGITTRAESDRRGLAIASCGNAALAAAVIARATRRPLHAFVPAGADRVVLARLRDLGTEVVVCHRTPGGSGDPCLARFRSALRAGALPFCCQGSENGLSIEGGKTLAWELVEALAQQGAALDRLFVQVGGGALASACVQALREAVAAGALERMPRIHPVQTAAGRPLARAFDRVRERILGHAPDAAADAEMGEALRAPALAPRVREALTFAAQHRPRFMWPWETEPRSLATGILDDETYDWLAVVAGMLETGGWPITVAEGRLAAAHALAREATGIAVSATGAAGLAGLMELREQGAIRPDETVAVLFTGVDR